MQLKGAAQEVAVAARELALSEDFPMSESPLQMSEDALIDPGVEGDRDGSAHHTALMVEHLRKTRPWVLFLAVLGFLCAGVMLLFAGAMSVVPLLESGGQEAPGTAAIVILGIFTYGSVGAFCTLFSVLLLRYARSIGRLVVGNKTEDMESTIDSQRLFFKYAGIATIVMFGLMILGVAVMLVSFLVVSMAVPSP